MRINEIINEASLGTQANFRRISVPNVTTVDLTAPWVQQAISQRRNTLKTVAAAETDKEKLDYLWNSGLAPSAIKIIGAKPGPKTKWAGFDNRVLTIDTYFRKTGEITCTAEATVNKVPVVLTYSGNVNDGIEYKGSTRKPTTYTFKVDGLKLVKTEKIEPVAKSTVQTDPWGKPIR